MSNELFPPLPGKLEVRRSPAWSTAVRGTPSGREYRAGNWQIPKGGITLGYDFLRADSATPELQTLLGFFHRHRGALYSFLFDDPEDNTATAQPFGAGDGARTTWPLVRTVGGFVQQVHHLAGAITVQAAGVTVAPSAYTTAYSAGALASITFTAPPAGGAQLTWAGGYHWRMRFARDELEIEKFLHQLYRTGQVELLYAPHG